MSNLYKRQLSSEEKEELAALNKAVEEAVSTRTVWLDNKMAEISKFKVGDAVYYQDGYTAGVVEELKRWHRGSAEYDTECSFYIQYRGRNTSTDFAWIGTKEDVRERKLQQLEYLKKELEIT